MIQLKCPNLAGLCSCYVSEDAEISRSAGETGQLIRALALSERQVMTIGYVSHGLPSKEDSRTSTKDASPPELTSKLVPPPATILSESASSAALLTVSVNTYRPFHRRLPATSDCTLPPSITLHPVLNNLLVTFSSLSRL